MGKMTDQEWEDLKSMTEEDFASVILNKTEPIAVAIEEVVFYDNINADEPGFWAAVRRRLEETRKSVTAMNLPLPPIKFIKYKMNGGKIVNSKEIQ